MGKHRATGVSRRAGGAALAVGTVPLVATLFGVGTAHAEVVPVPAAPPSMSVAVPAPPPAPAPNPVADPLGEFSMSVQEATTAAARSATDTFAAAVAPFVQSAPAGPHPPQVPAVEPAPIPSARALPQYLPHPPRPALHVPQPPLPVQPSEAPEGTLRIGDIVVDVPFDARGINQAAAQAESQLEESLDAAGIDRNRAERILGSAAVGAAVGNAVSSPLSIPTALVGAAAGFIVGIPFLPTGLVVGPVVGATIGYGIVAVPAMIAGASLGGAIGATDGFTTYPFEELPE